ncbi:Uncharacterized protein EbC_36220 [Erwinia billingiae Eb661]|uniref:Uncharacterized protein n=1 Tax=Erwinia billingiae (strain Eb661) TaxID=634500 RepID=D8MWE6_ERWBE|nr:Uncharacterized protein EbC_36220 [Erwinia billingiae Eb661]
MQSPRVIAPSTFTSITVKNGENRAKETREKILPTKETIVSQ